MHDFLGNKIHLRPYHRFMLGDLRNSMQFHVGFRGCNFGLSKCGKIVLWNKEIIPGLPNWTKWSTLISWRQDILMNIEVWFKNRVLAYPGAQAHGTHAICHAELSMFGCVKCGTINASQLFFQGSHVLSIFNLRIHACNKNKITTFYRWQWKYLTALLSKFVPYGHRSFKGKCGIKLKIIKKNRSSEHFETTWFLLLATRFISFLLPDFQEANPITKVDP